MCRLFSRPWRNRHQSLRRSRRSRLYVEEFPLRPPYGHGLPLLPGGHAASGMLPLVALVFRPRFVTRGLTQSLLPDGLCLDFSLLPEWIHEPRFPRLRKMPSEPGTDSANALQVGCMTHLRRCAAGGRRLLLLTGITREHAWPASPAPRRSPLPRFGVECRPALRGGSPA